MGCASCVMMMSALLPQLAPIAGPSSSAPTAFTTSVMPPALGATQMYGPGGEVIDLTSLSDYAWFEEGAEYEPCTISKEETLTMFEKYLSTHDPCLWAQHNSPYMCTKSGPPAPSAVFSLAYANALLAYSIFSAVCVQIFFASSKKKKAAGGGSRRDGDAGDGSHSTRRAQGWPLSATIADTASRGRRLYPASSRLALERDRPTIADTASRGRQLYICSQAGACSRRRRRHIPFWFTCKTMGGGSLRFCSMGVGSLLLPCFFSI